MADNLTADQQVLQVMRIENKWLMQPMCKQVPFYLYTNANTNFTFSAVQGLSWDVQ